MLEIIKAIILGIVEGITEWLPISSTGHMILVDEFLKLKVTPEFKEMFFVVIQLAAVMAVVILFWKKIFPFKLKGGFIDKPTFVLWFKIVVACLPAAVIGILFDDWIDKVFYNFVVVAFTLILYGFLFIDVENYNRHKTPKINDLSELTYKHALFIGLFQVLAVIPGTSRSGATIIGSLLLGISRTVAAEFSFFLAIPVMVGASALKILKFGFHFTTQELMILGVGCLVSFVVSIIGIRFLMNYVKKHDFKFFGYYRIILGGLVFLYFLVKFLVA